MGEFPWLELAQLVGESVPAFLRQTELLVIIVVVLLLVHMQYKRIGEMERRMYGMPLSDPVRNTGVALLYGAIGGLLATLLFVVLGISLIDVGIGYLWVLAIVLMTVHPRFLCFSYAGGLLSITHLLFGWPGLNVSAVMGLVAVLHLVESLLIWVHGARGTTPVYVRRGDGRVVGGFTLQKFWPMPFIALIAFMFGQAELGETTLAMPDWWPLIRPQAAAPEGQSYVYMLFPVIAALGYGDIAITRRPRVKARRTAAHLLVYSVVLMALALAGGGVLGGVGGGSAADGVGANGVEVVDLSGSESAAERAIDSGAMHAERAVDSGAMHADRVIDATAAAEPETMVAEEVAPSEGAVAPVAPFALGWQWLAAIFAIAGHEAVIHIGRKAEEKGDPVYDAADGAVVLDVAPGTPAEEMGLRTGDVIRTLNGYTIRSNADLRDVLTPWAVGVTMEVERTEGVGSARAASDHRGGDDMITIRYPGKLPPFGVILAPDPHGPWFMNLEDGGRYGVMLRNLGRRIGSLFGRR